MATTPTVPAFTRVSQLAADRRVHKAFQWIHLHERQIMRWQTDLVSIPAPPFAEGPRAEWLCARFNELGLSDVHMDAIGNAISNRFKNHPHRQRRVQFDHWEQQHQRHSKRCQK